MLNNIHHMILAASKLNNECYTFRDVLKEDDAAEFIKTMKVETEAHEKQGHWEITKRSCLPAGTKTIQAI